MHAHRAKLGAGVNMRQHHSKTWNMFLSKAFVLTKNVCQVEALRRASAEGPGLYRNRWKPFCGFLNSFFPVECVSLCVQHVSKRFLVFLLLLDSSSSWIRSDHNPNGRHTALGACWEYLLLISFRSGFEVTTKKTYFGLNYAQNGWDVKQIKNIWVHSLKNPSQVMNQCKSCRHINGWV